MKKLKPIYRLLIVVVVCLALGTLLGRGCRDTVHKISPETIEALEGYALYYERKKDGTEKVVAPTAQITIKDLEAYNDSLYNVFKKDLGRDVRRVQSGKVIHTETTIEKKVPVHDTIIVTSTDTVRDTIAAKAFGYSDEWTNITGLIIDGNAKLEYKTRADLRVYTKWKRNGLFKPKTLETEIHTNNPHLSVERVQSMQNQAKPKWHERRGVRIALTLASFGVGVYAGTQIN